MSYRERVEEIAALLQTLPGAGQVHARTRLVSDWGRFLQAFTVAEGGARRVTGWMVTRRALTPKSPRAEEIYTITRIRGLSDPEETDFAFQEDLDAAYRLFLEHADLTFGQVADGLQVPTAEVRMFAGVLCHVADCELVVSLYDSDL